jgi:hypothetical protein
LLWFLPRLPLLGSTFTPYESLALVLGIADSIVAAFALAFLSFNYRNAEPLGRRRLKWIMVGLYAGGLPLMAIPIFSFLSPDRFEFVLISAIAGIATAAVPLSFVISIVRYNLFDVDKLLGGAASHMIFLVILAVVGEAVIEPFGTTVATSAGLDADTGQLVFVGGFAALLYPAQRRWRHIIDRLFFSDAQSLEAGVEDLLASISQEPDRERTFQHLGASLASLFEPTTCVIYASDGQIFSPVFESPAASAPELSDIEELKAALDVRLRPVSLDKRGGGGLTFAGGEEADAAFTRLDTAVLLPLRPNGEANVFVSLGVKCSFDVYTTTDLALLASIAHAASVALACFPSAESDSSVT